ncbi:MAG: hypothetical protein S4CHLAM45_02120 [Chlamydiales bacterium]|nr:hypothetical protein [Chlamydiales bacterium]MCH9620348.1 hypothetical protein [Chlamydiales bacterium]MCH9622334.1 hypothetical protein [Chlamydiales bacterium]
MQDESGAVYFFGRSFFPWGALPYPLEHARLGRVLHKLGKTQIAKKMASWQKATLDHAEAPIYSLFLQEKGCTRDQLNVANLEFFKEVGLPNHIYNPFVNQSLGFVNFRKENATILCTGTGCKSGMGVITSGDAGIINFGPQLPPIWECSGFGLAGRATNTSYRWEGDGFELSYHTRLSSPSHRDTGFKSLQDSGFSAVWMNVRQKLYGNSLETACTFEGTGLEKELRFSIFGKGEACLVDKLQRLTPKSLDRFEGPALPFELLGEKGRVEVVAREGFGKMEIIPLAADESYWGADFLISFKIDQRLPIHLTFNLEN